MKLESNKNCYALPCRLITDIKVDTKTGNYTRKTETQKQESKNYSFHDMYI